MFLFTKSLHYIAHVYIDGEIQAICIRGQCTVPNSQVLCQWGDEVLSLPGISPPIVLDRNHQ